MSRPAIRHDWTRREIRDLFARPFNDLLFDAHTIHRRFFDPNVVQVCTLLSVKTGGCPEDCKYCAQSAHYNTGLQAQKRMGVEDVVRKAREAQDAGATRFCMGAAWRNPRERDMEPLCEMIRSVKSLGMETCVTVGMLTRGQANRLCAAGLDYCNHNIDTSEEFYPEIVTTRTFADRLETLRHVREAGIKVCCGGILGMGESNEDRAEMLRTLANLPEHPESAPINRLMPMPGTPLEDATPPDDLDFVRVIAVARSLMPRAYVRLSAGREAMSDTMQALCFFAGANSIFLGDKLLTAPNPDADDDRGLLTRLGMRVETLPNDKDAPHIAPSREWAAVDSR